jgi:hypothetical protein
MPQICVYRNRNAASHGRIVAALDLLVTGI